LVDGADSAVLRVRWIAGIVQPRQLRRQMGKHWPADGRSDGRSANARSELRRQITVDLESEADLDKYWCGPDHMTSSLCDYATRRCGLLAKLKTPARKRCSTMNAGGKCSVCRFSSAWGAFFRAKRASGTPCKRARQQRSKGA